MASSDGLRHRRGGQHREGLTAPLLDTQEEEASEEEPLLAREPSDGHVFREDFQGPLQAIVQVVLSSWSYLIERLSICLHLKSATKPLVLTPSQEEALQKLRSRKAVAFDISLTEHQDALKRLWSLGYPGVQLTGLKSPQWKDMGWQGNDPSTDFRGAGYLALDNLIYFAEHHHKEFCDLMKKADGARSEWEYPFCVAGVNLTFNLLGARLASLQAALSYAWFCAMRRPQHYGLSPSPSLLSSLEILDVQEGSLPRTDAGHNFFSLLVDESSFAFEEIYCVAFRALDKKWLEMNASYMDFPAVMKAVMQQLELSISKATSLEGVGMMMGIAL